MTHMKTTAVVWGTAPPGSFVKPPPQSRRVVAPLGGEPPQARIAKRGPLGEDPVTGQGLQDLAGKFGFGAEPVPPVEAIGDRAPPNSVVENFLDLLELGLGEPPPTAGSMWTATSRM